MLGCCFKHVVARFGSDSTGICSIFEYIHVQRLFSDMAGKALVNFPRLKGKWRPARLCCLCHDQIPDETSTHDFLRTSRPHFYNFIASVFTLPRLNEFERHGKWHSLVCNYMAVFLRDLLLIEHDVGHNDVVVLKFWKVCDDFHYTPFDMEWMTASVKKDYTSSNLINEDPLTKGHKSSEAVLDSHSRMIRTALDDISALHNEVRAANVTNTELRGSAREALFVADNLKRENMKMKEDI